MNLQAACDDFNAKYPVGTKVFVRRDNGEMQETVTRSKAEVLSGHSAVIWIEGISGCYLLDRVHPVAEAAVSKQDETMDERARKIVGDLRKYSQDWRDRAADIGPINDAIDLIIDLSKATAA